MFTTLNKILELSKLDNFKTTINYEQIIEAKGLIKKLPQSTKELFQILCSMNLINAALKSKEFNDEIYYGMLKPKVSMLLEYIIENNSDFTIEIYVDDSKYCAYIELYNLQFSFHNISIGEKLKGFIKSPLNKPVNWKGLRLQKIAGELFEYSKKGASYN